MMINFCVTDSSHQAIDIKQQPGMSELTSITWSELDVQLRIVTYELTAHTVATSLTL